MKTAASPTVGRYALLLTSAILFPLTLPSPLFSYGNALLGAISLVPLYLFIVETSETRTLLRGGALFGTVSTIIANFWLAFFQDFSVWTLGGATFGYLIYNTILFAFLGLIRRRTPVYRPFLFVLVWVGYEYLKSVGFLGYPWGLAAYALSAHPLALQLAEITGVWGISAAVVLFSALVAEGIAQFYLERRNVALRLALFAGALPLILWGYGLYAQERAVTVKREIGLLLVQQNVDSWEPGNFAGALARAQDLSKRGLAEAPGPVDLVVWSETSLRRPYEEEEWRVYYEENPVEQPFSQFLGELGRPLLTGSPVVGEHGYMNGVLLLDSSGEILGKYGKQQLVPFAERVPFWEQEAVKRFFSQVIGLEAAWVPGGSSEPVEIPVPGEEPLPAGSPICFEDAFTGVVGEMVEEGATALINLTNNSWSRSDSAQIQHFAAARFRSIEYRIALARSTNSGITTVIDAHGRRGEELPMFEAGAMYARLPVYEGVGETPYARLGPWLPALALLATALLLLRERSAGNSPTRFFRIQKKDDQPRGRSSHFSNRNRSP